MNCRNCGDPMVKGFLQSSSDIVWVPDLYRNKGEKNFSPNELSNLDLSTLRITAFRCINCNIIQLTMYKVNRTDSLTCTSCGSSITDSSKFCTDCGAEIETNSEKPLFVCPKCNNPVESNDILCPSCGIDLDKFGNDILNTCVECGYSDPSLEDLAECPKCGALLPI